jgi:hypothetical protein
LDREEKVHVPGKKSSCSLCLVLLLCETISNGTAENIFNILCVVKVYFSTVVALLVGCPADGPPADEGLYAGESRSVVADLEDDIVDGEGSLAATGGKVIGDG